MQKSTEHYHYLDLIGEPVKLELNFYLTPEHVTEVIFSISESLQLRLTNWVFFQKTFSMGKSAKGQFFKNKPFLKY